LNEMGSGAGAMASSSLKMYCLIASQPVPPHSGDAFVQDAHPALHLVLADALAELALAAQLGRQRGGEEGAHLVAEGEFFVGVAEVHGVSSR